jgi:hypothetical protein
MYDDDGNETLMCDVNSNSWRSGIRPRERSVMPCCGEMRSVKPESTTFTILTLFQIEYLVVTYSQNEPKVLLSLRQAEILEALAADKELAKKGGCVPDLQDVTSGNRSSK